MSGGGLNPQIPLWLRHYARLVSRYGVHACKMILNIIIIYI